VTCQEGVGNWYQLGTKCIHSQVYRGYLEWFELPVDTWWELVVLSTHHVVKESTQDKRKKDQNKQKCYAGNTSQSHATGSYECRYFMNS